MFTVLCNVMLRRVPCYGCAVCASLRDTGRKLRRRIFVTFVSSQRGLESLTCCSAISIHVGGMLAYTGWRKKNACFSNNCNSVCFQYKKIVLTPKQPVINAVLITYVDYLIMENYIGKMASFLPYTRPEPLLKVLHHIY